MSRAVVILQLLRALLLSLTRPYDPRPAWLSRYGNCPADGFHRFSFPGFSPKCGRDLLAPFLIGLGAFFLTAAVLPASVVKNAVETGMTIVDVLQVDVLQDDVLQDRAEIVTLENPGLGITDAGFGARKTGFAADFAADFHGEILDGAFMPADIKPNSGPGDVPEVSVADSALSAESPSIAARLGALSNSHAVWMVAFSPWVWCLVAWHVPPQPRRRIRRPAIRGRRPRVDDQG